MEQKIFCLKTFHKTYLSKLFKQDTEGSSISTHFQREVGFSRTLKIMTLVKIIGKRLPHNLGL